MELTKIDLLINKYFDAETTLAEEQQLRDYFNSGNVAPHLQQYAPMFCFFAEEEDLSYNRPLQFEAKPDYRRWFSVAAAVIVVAGGFTWFYINGETAGRQDMGTYNNPEVAFRETQKALNMLSKNVNVGVESMSYIGEYEKTRKSIFKK